MHLTPFRWIRAPSAETDAVTRNVLTDCRCRLGSASLRMPEAASRKPGVAAYVPSGTSCYLLVTLDCLLRFTTGEPSVGVTYHAHCEVAARRAHLTESGCNTNPARLAR